MAINPADPYAQEALAEAAPFNRQREMAKILQQQAFTQPQGQMVSGRYVAPSFFQYLAPAVSGLASKHISEKADKEQLAQAAALRAASANDLSRAQQIAQGQEAIPSQQGPTPEGGNLDMTTGQKAVAANPQLAAQELLKSRDPTLRALGLDYLKGEKLGEGEIKTSGIFGTLRGAGKEKQYDLGDRVIVKGADGTERVLHKGISLESRARLADEGIAIPGVSGGGSGGGTTPTVAPTQQGGGANSPAATQANTGNIKAGSPAVLNSGDGPSGPPVYVNDPALSPKQNREAKAKIHTAWSEERAKNVKNANDSFGTIRAANEILSTGEASSGFFSNALTTAAEAADLPFGLRKDKSGNDKTLKILGSKLTMQVPRFEGPQSDKDTALYQAAAGDIGNPNVPIDTRRAALKTLVSLHQKYAPDKKWTEIFPDSVDNSNPLLKR